MNRRPFLTAPGHAALWAGLGLLAAFLLGFFALFDLSDFGHNWSDAGPHPYAVADRVSYGLGVWRSFYAGDTLTANPTYPLLWGWALLNVLLLWPARKYVLAARVMWWIYALTLAFLLLAGLTLLPYATTDHNTILAAHGDLPRDVSAVGALEVKQCTRWLDGCQAWDESRVLNPAPLGLLGLLLAPLLGLAVSVWQWCKKKG